MAVEFEEIVIDGEPRTGPKDLCVANPKPGMVSGANRAPFQQFCLNDVESLFLGRRKQDDLWRRQICGLHFALRGLSLGRLAETNGEWKDRKSTRLNSSHMSI